MEPDRDDRECAGEAGEQQYDRENQPDMVRFPYRGDGFCDDLALLRPAWPGGQQIPHPTAKIGTTEQHVGGQ